MNSLMNSIELFRFILSINNMNAKVSIIGSLGKMGIDCKL